MFRPCNSNNDETVALGKTVASDAKQKNTFFFLKKPSSKKTF